MTGRNVVRMAGVPFIATTIDDAAAYTVEHSLVGNYAEPIRLMNAYCVALASQDPDYFQMVSTTGTNYPDGTPVAWVMRRCGAPEASQVRGPSFFVRTIELGAERGLRNFFFGTTESTLTLLEDEVAKRFPGVIVAGSAEAPFGPVEEILSDEIVEQIRAAEPHIVWVGLGTPKQDIIAAELARRLGLPCAGVGAAFDFVAGTQPEAPDFVKGHGLEWLYRLVSEPKRLWRRYLWGNTRFIRLAVEQLVLGRR